ncbi:preprotein translocase subunit YajC [Actinomyces sp. 2119]|uniref:Preprotein translocase subunit YajC n=2 Tax=Actinomycetaceae TaxID=2049 RepID=A0ABM6Z6G7_9ACTO|nr:preprotein translocase subunit YajC [Actinomyces lilanjuaniae]RJF44938.1 preprotein translocase subunit YajC [Actinomyces sp. 2119]
MLVVMMGVFWLFSVLGRRQQQRMAEEQARRTEEALVPGTWVRTTAGFYGKVVEADGDVVTLATPLGDETLWAKRSIVGAEEPPFAVTGEADEDDEPEDDDPEGEPDQDAGGVGDIDSDSDAEAHEEADDGGDTGEEADTAEDLRQPRS